MTPDESTWTRFAAAVLASGEDPRPAHAAVVADDMMRELRERRGAGAFGPVASEASLDATRALLKEIQCDRDDAVERGLEWNRQLQLAVTERDELRARAEAAEDLLGLEQRVRAAEYDGRRKAESFLKEALGPLAVVANMPTQPLNGLVYVVDPVTRGQATDVLAKAKAAGYEP